MPRLTRPSPMPPEVRAITEVIGNMARTEILHMLSKESLTAPEITERLGADRGGVHKHLRVLEEAGLIVGDLPPDHRRGRTVRWSARRDMIISQALEWARYATNASDSAPSS